MADFKMTVIFGAQKGGWTESWYLTATNFSAAQTQAFAYLNARAQNMAEGAFIDAVRIVSTVSVGQSDFSDVPPQYTRDRRVTGLRDTIQTTIVFRTQSEFGSRRMFEMSGLPDDSVVFDTTFGEMVFTDAARGRGQAFMNAIIAIPVKIRCLTKNSAVVNQKMINGISLVSAGLITVTSPAHGFAANDEIRISRVTNVARSAVTGVWRVLSVTADTFTFLNPAAELAFTVGPGGIVRRRVFGYEPIVSGGPLRIGNRKRGRAFFLPVGRRKAR